jgi:hypothetical protein
MGSEDGGWRYDGCTGDTSGGGDDCGAMYATSIGAPSLVGYMYVVGNSREL